MLTMGGNGMLDALVVSGPLWLAGLIVLAIMLARRRVPGAARLWTRTALRSAPFVGTLTLVMSASWMSVTALNLWNSGKENILATLGEFVLMFGTPTALVWLLWTRHVHDLGVFTRPSRVVLAMTLLPILALIAFAALNATRAG